MVKTRSQTKKQEEERFSIKKDGVWNLVYDMYGTYYVITDNCDDYHEFKAKDYDGGEPTAYRQALKYYYSRV